jgi:hypothetical protein
VSEYHDGYTNSSSSQVSYLALLLPRSQPRAHNLEAENRPPLIYQTTLHPLEEAARQVVHGNSFSKGVASCSSEAGRRSLQGRLNTMVFYTEIGDSEVRHDLHDDGFAVT